MGNRIEKELCTGCGAPLLFPFNEYRMCRTCTEKVKKVIYETKMHRARKDIRKGVLNVRRNHIWMATKPLGTDA